MIEEGLRGIVHYQFSRVIPSDPQCPCYCSISEDPPAIKIGNRYRADRQNRTEWCCNETRNFKYFTQYYHSQVCLIAVMNNLLRGKTTRAPKVVVNNMG